MVGVRRWTRPWRALSAVLLAATFCTLHIEATADAACLDPSSGTPPRAPEPDGTRPLIFYGYGIGHGMGMSQHGARGAARLGCSTARILTTYYPGTHLTAVDTSRRLDVLLFAGGPGHRALVTTEPGSTITWRHRNGDVAVQPAGTTWRVKPNGGATRLTDSGGRIRFDARATSKFPLRAWHTNEVVRVRTFRDGALDVDRRLKYDAGQYFASGGRLDARQSFYTNWTGNAMNKYLRGLAEVPVSWPAAALRAQAIAGRTFAVRLGRPLRPTAADQYYGGYDPLRDSRTSPWRKAVGDTSGQIVADAAGQPIKAYYSASMGGYTEDARYVWGVDEGPYIRAVDDSRWNAASADQDTNRRWARSFTYTRIADEFGFDRVTAMGVAKRGSTARHRGVRITGRIDGATVTRYVTGWDVRQQLGLPSPGFFIVTR